MISWLYCILLLQKLLIFAGKKKKKERLKCRNHRAVILWWQERGTSMQVCSFVIHSCSKTSKQTNKQTGLKEIARTTEQSCCLVNLLRLDTGKEECRDHTAVIIAGGPAGWRRAEHCVLIMLWRQNNLSAMPVAPFCIMQRVHAPRDILGEEELSVCSVGLSHCFSLHFGTAGISKCSQCQTLPLLTNFPLLMFSWLQQCYSHCTTGIGSVLCQCLLVLLAV